MSSQRRRASQRRGARILLWVLGLFMLGQIAGGIVLDYVWVRPRFPHLADLYADLQARKRAPEIVFLGSSRFAGDINCGVLDAELQRELGNQAPRTFSAWIPAGDPTAFERIAEGIFRRGLSPAMVVVEVTPGTLNRYDNWLTQHAFNLLDWRDVAQAIPPLCRNGRIMNLFRGRMLPLYLHRHHICKEMVALATSWFRSVPTTGGSDPPVPPPWESDPEPPVVTTEVRALQEKGYAFGVNEVRKFSPTGMGAARLERLLNRCQSLGVAVLLVDPPVSSPYRRAFTPEVTGAFRQYVQALIDRYGCSFVDWSDHVPDEYFVDCHHVHAAGGVFFSRRFAATVLAPSWTLLGPAPL